MSAACAVLAADSVCFMQYLQCVSDCLKPCGKQAAFFLAAAVSDFFLPWKQMVSCTDELIFAGSTERIMCAIGLWYSCLCFRQSRE